MELMVYNWVEKILIECKTVLNRQNKQPWSIQGKEERYFDKIWHPKERQQLPFIEYPTSKTLDASFHLISVIYKLGPNVFISRRRAWRLSHMGAQRGGSMNPSYRAQYWSPFHVCLQGWTVGWEQVCCAEIWQGKLASFPVLHQVIPTSHFPLN